ncbi:MAG: hypothetical protein ABI654_12885 [Betaproteobacteria bacterium]
MLLIYGMAAAPSYNTAILVPGKLESDEMISEMISKKEVVEALMTPKKLCIATQRNARILPMPICDQFECGANDRFGSEAVVRPPLRCIATMIRKFGLNGC